MLQETAKNSDTLYFVALGAEWMVTKGARPTYHKEAKRLRECLQRLERVRFLPVKPERLLTIVGWVVCVFWTL